MMRENKMSRFCFSLACFCLAGATAWCADTAALRTTVRVDRGSGRLIRTQIVQPRDVPAIEVIARDVSSPVPVSPAPISPAKATTPGRADVDLLVEQSAATHGVDPILAKSVLAVESNYNQYALSPKGAMGLMQLMPATAKQLGVINAFDARQNIEGGVKFLRYLKTKFDDDRLVLAAYNAGEAAVKKHGWIPPYPETIDYVYKVGKRYGDSMRQSRSAVAISGDKPADKPTDKPVARIQQVIDADGRIHLQMQ